MKKIIFSLLAIGCFFLVGCLDTTQEVTIKADGSGTISTTSDFSAIIGLAKQMGGAAELEKAGQENMDTTFSLQQGADSIPNLTDEQKSLIRTGTMKVKMNMKDEKAFTNLSFPFSKISDIERINKISSKVMGDVMSKQMKEAPAGVADQMPEVSSIDDYYKYEFSEGELTRKVDKSKYAGVESDQYLKGMMQMSQMGIPLKTTYVFNLPRAASKAEGKNVKLSDDKMKVTVSASLDDFLSDPSVFEFKIKY